MSDVKALNYTALNLKSNVQLGSEKKAQNNETNYKDGLSLNECKKIDKNGDGMITEAEFKAAAGNNYSTAWTEYIDFYGAKTSGNVTTQTLPDGRQIKTTVDSKGKKTSETVTENDGTVVTKKYNSDGKVESTKTEYKDGSTVTKHSDGSTTRTTGTNPTYTTKTDKNGNITKLKAGNDDVTISYDKNGKPVSAKVNGKTYKNIVVKDNGQIIVKNDSKKSNVLSISTQKNGRTNVVVYGEPKTKQTKYELDSDKGLYSYYNYDENGKASKRTFCENGKYRTYTRDKSGNIKYSEDYTKDNVRTSKQTYLKDGDKIYDNNDNAIWDSRIIYESDGKTVKRKEEYTYSKEKNGDVTKNTTYTDKSGNTTKTRVENKDSYSNTKSYTDTNKKTGEQTTTTNYYDNTKKNDNLNAKVQPSHITEKEIVKKDSKGNVVETKEQKISNQNVTEEKTTDSSGKITDKKYTYNPDGKKASEEEIKHDGLHVITRFSPADGETKTSQVTLDQKGRDIEILKYKENGSDLALKTTNTWDTNDIHRTKTIEDFVNNTVREFVHIEDALDRKYSGNTEKVNSLKSDSAILKALSEANGTDEQDPLVEYNKMVTDFEVHKTAKNKKGYSVKTTDTYKDCDLKHKTTETSNTKDEPIIKTEYDVDSDKTVEYRRLRYILHKEFPEIRPQDLSGSIIDQILKENNISELDLLEYTPGSLNLKLSEEVKGKIEDSRAVFSGSDTFTDEQQTYIDVYQLD